MDLPIKPLLFSATECLFFELLEKCINLSHIPMALLLVRHSCSINAIAVENRSCFDEKKMKIH
jgi:hypothetical protein